MIILCYNKITRGENVKEIVKEMYKLYLGDCLEVMSILIDKGVVVDAIITDPPYGVTACSWDSPIPFNNFIMQPKSKRSKKMVPIYRDEYILQELKKGRDYKEICEYFDKNSKEGMWQKLNKLIKPNGAIVLFGSEPFSSALRMSNIKNYKYDWVWEKEQGANFMLMKYQPYKVHENILVFSNKTHFYNPQKTKGKPYISGKGLSGEAVGNVKKVQTKNSGDRFPRSVLKFTTDKSKSKHPTQKPVALMEYLIKTYTNEGDLVLDFAMGSGTTGVACMNLNRKFIGIELNEKYFNIALQRIEEARKNREKKK
jgi:site-specific DNA-methyltransferase (adenine-specific)